MIYVDYSAMVFVGAATEVESLKMALAEAKKKAAKEQAAREKHEARVNEVQQELQDAMKKCESLERNIADQESELAKARQSTQDALQKKDTSMTFWAERNFFLSYI